MGTYLPTVQQIRCSARTVDMNGLHVPCNGRYSAEVLAAVPRMALPTQHRGTKGMSQAPSVRDLHMGLPRWVSSLLLPLASSLHGCPNSRRTHTRLYPSHSITKHSQLVP